VLSAAAGSALIGCGDGHGFAIPATTSTLIVSGVSGTTTHSTSLTLTVQ